MRSTNSRLMLPTTDKRLSISLSWHGKRIADYSLIGIGHRVVHGGLHLSEHCITNHVNIHVRGYLENGTTTTPFDMVVLNYLDRFHLVADVVDRVPQLGPSAAYLKQLIRDKLIDHRQYVNTHGQDLPEVRDWKWAIPQPR